MKSNVASPDLSSISLLSSLPAPMRADYEAICAVEEFDSGTEIITSQERTNSVLFILDGKVRVVEFSPAGREISFEILEPGSVVGELAAIDGHRRSAAVKAETAVRVAIMPGPRFVELVTHHPSVADATLKRLAAMLRRSTQRIMELSSLGARSRVHAELLRLAVLGEDGHTAFIKKMPVHSDIASRVSTTRESVARAMGDLLRKSIVEKRNGGLKILDVTTLQSMVDDLT